MSEMIEGRNKAAEPPVIDLTGDFVAPDECQSDPCYRVLVEHLPTLDADVFDHFQEAPQCIRAMNAALMNALAVGELQRHLQYMREFIRMAVKGRRGRPKGSARKLPVEAIPLWKQGIARAAICRKLKIPYAEGKAFQSCFNAAIRRLRQNDEPSWLAGKAAQNQARLMNRKASSALRT